MLAMRVPRARCDRGLVGVEQWYHGMLTQSSHRGRASQMGGPLLCLAEISNVGVQEWAAGHLVHSNLHCGVAMFCLLCFPQYTRQ